MVSLTAANTATPSFNPSDPGDYLFELTINGSCVSDTDQVEVRIYSAIAPNAVNVEPLTSQSNAILVQVAHAGDGRLFLVDRRGYIWIWDGVSILATPYLDISTDISGTGGETGLLGLAFAPDYAVSGFFYVNYTRTNPACGPDSLMETVVEGFQVSADPNVADPLSGTDLLVICQTFTNHNGGCLQFGSDGYLYIGMGDGGDPPSEFNPAQNTMSLLGKMLRYQTNGLAPFSIPSSNPFVGDPTTLDPIWASGLRNPWRFSFDRFTGDLYIGDVGEGTYEEVDHQGVRSPGGENYGWFCREGAHPNPDLIGSPMICTSPPPFTDPIAEYTHTFGCSITGGYVYNSTTIPTLRGSYLFVDWCQGQMMTVRREGASWVQRDLDMYVSDTIFQSFGITGFGEGFDGELYFVIDETVFHFDSFRN